MDDAIAAFVARELGGRTTLVRDHSWSHGKSKVLELRAPSGQRSFLKHHRVRDNYRVEIAAYRRWTPALGDRAPAVLAVDDGLQAILFTAAPGRSPTDLYDPQMHRDAGAVLRLLHDAEQLPPWVDMAGDKEFELDRWAARSAGLLAGRELDFARSAVRSLADAATPALSPCHLDYTPRNWVVSDGRVHVIDFEESRPEVWVNDLARLYFGPWRESPQLMPAFLDGYGRRPTDAELAVMRASYALTAVRHVVMARELGLVEVEAAVRRNLADLMRAAAAD